MKKKLISEKVNKILITGGAGFIGGALIRKLLKETDSLIFNIDKLGYASDLKSINNLIQAEPEKSKRYKFIELNLEDKLKTEEIIMKTKPDLIFHLAAESHVDKSIKKPDFFITSNILGTFNLIEAVRKYYNTLSNSKKDIFRFHHISTDEVFGSLGDKGFFNEKTSYNPKSPYSASKAASDHIVKAWHNTYHLPILLTNCSNNYGPWQYPEKLIPITITNALNKKNIPLYGNGENIRDWLFVEDHVDAILLVAKKGLIGESYCIGGNQEKSNKEIMSMICEKLNKIFPKSRNHLSLIKNVDDRQGHDYRYAIDSTKIKTDLGWHPKYSFEEGLDITINWYLENRDWCQKFFQ